jgi:hypothetical protein
VVRHVRLVGGGRHLASSELGHATHDLGAVPADRKLAEHVGDHRLDLFHALIDAGAGQLSHPLAHVSERNFSARRRCLHPKHARVGRKLGQQRRDERGLADAHLAVDHPGRHQAEAAVRARRDRVVISGVQVGELGVAADQVARRERHLLQLFLPR